MPIGTKGTMFDPKLVNDLVTKVKGHSSIALLSKQTPVSFTGNKEFTFSLDSDIDIVAENGKKSHGGLTITPVVIAPIKFEYGARVSDEFMTATEEAQLNILQAFNDGFAKKVARGLDIAAFHGLNPRTSTASDVVGNNCFDKAVTQTVNYAAATVDENIEAAIALVEGSGGEVTGLAGSPAVRQALAALKTTAGERLYPDLAWGGNPGTVNGLPVDFNKTVSVGDTDQAIVGDFENMLKWGYAKEVPLEVIPYGDPDNSGVDLKGSNQIYLRAEIYLGWGILDPNSFARVKNA